MSTLRDGGGAFGSGSGEFEIFPGPIAREGFVRVDRTYDHVGLRGEVETCLATPEQWAQRPEAADPSWAAQEVVPGLIFAQRCKPHF